jgi:hypothetical protein
MLLISPSITTYNFTHWEKIMKNLHRFYVAVVLILLLATHAYAGDMHTPVPTPPQPASAPVPMEGEMTTGLNGTIHTGDPGDMHTGEATAEEVLAEAVVGLVHGVLALL